jgi:hypothetical protein
MIFIVIDEGKFSRADESTDQYERTKSTDSITIDRLR